VLIGHRRSARSTDVRRTGGDRNVAAHRRRMRTRSRERRSDRCRAARAPARRQWHTLDASYRR
jgi:hypothetical protein